MLEKSHSFLCVFLTGAVINKLAPEWLITFCLVTTLAYTAKRTWDKGFSTYEKETDANKVLPHPPPRTDSLAWVVDRLERGNGGTLPDP